jgi:hypothetical protein
MSRIYAFPQAILPPNLGDKIKNHNVYLLCIYLRSAMGT